MIIGSVQAYSHDSTKYNIEVIQMRKKEDGGGVRHPASAHIVYLRMEQEVCIQAVE